MAQTTSQVSLGCGYIAISTDGAAWTDISGSTQSLEETTQTRITGEVYTLDGDAALPCGGKIEPTEITVNIVYTETDAEAYEIVRLIFEGSTSCGTGDIYLRWAPRGNSAGNEQITTGAGTLVSFTYPPMNASEGGCILTGFTVRVGSLTTSIIAS